MYAAKTSDLGKLLKVDGIIIIFRCDSISRTGACKSVSQSLILKGGRAFEVFWTYDCITQEPDVRSWSNFACEALFCH